ncbi:MAG: hypothetical protein HZB42_14200 [Sphingobacteriales bacterium]|nr:hypothetical protein [Sphingobacteriales bacterium]
MKKIIGCFALLIIASTFYGQQSKPSPVLTKQDYLKKSKKQKTAAWVFMGAGITTFLLGTMETDSELGKSERTRSGTAIVVGLASIGTSIAFFISATKNRNKAASLGLKMETSPLIQQNSFVHRSFPALSVRLNL